MQSSLNSRRVSVSYTGVSFREMFVLEECLSKRGVCAEGLHLTAV